MSATHRAPTPDIPANFWEVEKRGGGNG